MKNNIPLDTRLGIFYDLTNIYFSLNRESGRKIWLSQIKFGVLQKLVGRNVSPIVSIAFNPTFSNRKTHPDFTHHLRDAKIEFDTKPGIYTRVGRPEGNVDVALASAVTGLAIKFSLSRIAIVSSDIDFLDIPDEFKKREFLPYMPEFEFHYFKIASSKKLIWVEDPNIKTFDLSMKIPDLITGYSKELKLTGTG